MEKLKEIVSKVFETDIMMKKRTRNNVEARMIYAKILRDELNTFASIGKSINKDHSTMVYYSKEVKHLLEQSKELYNKYILCKDSYIKNQIPNINPVTKKIENELIELKFIVNKLSSERKNVIKMQEKYNRFENILNLVAERTRIGNEALVERKIREMFNNM